MKNIERKQKTKNFPNVTVTKYSLKFENTLNIF